MPRRWSIPYRWKVAALPAVSCLGVALTVALVQVRLTSERIAREAGLEVADVAVEVAERLSRDMAARGTELLLLAQVRTHQGPSPAGQIRSQLELLQHSVPHYAWIGYLDAQGRVVAATRGLFEGGSGAGRPVYTEGRKGLWFGDVHPAVVLESILNPDGGAPLEFVDVATPVHDAGQQLQGVMAAHLGWEWARQVTEEVLRPHENRHRLEVMIAEAQGRLILGPKAQRHRPLPIGSEALPAPGERYRLARWDDGVQAMTAVALSGPYRLFPGLGWQVVVRQPIDVALSEARAAGRQIFAWGAGVGLAFLILGLWLARRVSQPVHRLMHATGALRQVRAGGRAGAERRQADVTWVAELLQQMDRDLASREQQVRQLRYDASHDALTGLPNRAFLAVLLERAEQPGTALREVIAMCFDLDDFKHVNDRHGHDAGDAVLREVAWRLRCLLRDEDVPIRLGGDEFLVLVEAVPGDGDRLADAMAARLIQALSVPVDFKDQRLEVGCSAGVVVWHSDAGVPLLEAWHQADRALLQVKTEGKCGWLRRPLLRL
jgi:diguanylate cyclase (GGDEF)-like protein